MKTRLTGLPGVGPPIGLEAMSWISKPELVAAVSDDVETGGQSIGQPQGLIGDIPGAGEPVARIVDDAERAGAALCRPAPGS